MTDSTRPPMLAGWYHDPSGVGDARYWNGSAWTTSISTGGVTQNVPIDADKARVPPVPGTEFTAPTPPPAQPMPVQTAPSSGNSSSGVVTAIVVGAVVIIAVVTLAIVFGGSDSNDGPTPTDGPPQTDAPIGTPAGSEAPAEGGG